MSRTWAYWLQNVTPSEVASSGLDTVVIEIFDVDGKLLDQESVSEMGGGTADPRTLLGYISVGEAENYRPYWQPDWNTQLPSWIGSENPEWEGNFRVQFWAQEWKDILFDYLEDMVKAGYDGAWFDVVDVYQTSLAMERADPGGDMVDLVEALSQHAKVLNTSFKIYINGAEELLVDPRFLAAIDGVGKENAYFGLAGQNSLNSSSEINWTVNHLKLAQAAGKDVLVIEYVSDPAAITETLERSLANGFAPYVGPLDLDTLDLTVGRMVATSIQEGRANLIFYSSKADEVFNGGAAVDTVVFSAAHEAYKFAQHGDGTTSILGPNEHDVLVSIERVQFTDVSVAFDENAKLAFLLYQAAFNRASDTAGLGYWISELDSGRQSHVTMAAHLLESAEFTATNGTIGNLPTATLINLIYRNVLGHPASPLATTYWSTKLDGGMAAEQFILSVAGSAESKHHSEISLVGGVHYSTEW